MLMMVEGAILLVTVEAARTGYQYSRYVSSVKHLDGTQCAVSLNSAAVSEVK